MPARHVSRLPAFDYRTSGAYFVTVCTAGRMPLLGTLRDGVMHPSAFGHIVAEEWALLPERRRGIRLDAFVVMPDHIHGILWILPGSRRDTACRVLPFAWHEEDTASRVPTYEQIRHLGPQTRGSLHAIIGGFKPGAARRINALRGTPGAAVWQPRFHDRVIRDATELAHARRYVAENPAQTTPRP